jgi:hypothetical protein
MRILIAGLLGGIVFFIWGALSHTVLGLGDMGMRYGTPYQEPLAAMKANGGEAGIYLLPSLSEERAMDEAAIQALATESAGQGYALVIYSPQDNPGFAGMGTMLGKQFVTDVLSSLILACLLAMGGLGFGKRVLMAGLAGGFAWLVVSVPYWTWYQFPLDYTLGLAGKYLVGWVLAGAAMAWWLGRKGG